MEYSLNEENTHKRKGDLRTFVSHPEEVGPIKSQNSQVTFK